MGIGLQTAQTTHAALHFFQQHPDLSTDWMKNSNYLVCLAVADEVQLQLLLTRVQKENLQHVAFYEPDLNNQLTALCLEPSPQARKITSAIPLMGKGYKYAQNPE